MTPRTAYASSIFGLIAAAILAACTPADKQADNGQTAPAPAASAAEQKKSPLPPSPTTPRSTPSAQAFWTA